MRRVFDSWDWISSRVRTADEIALFLDFDGTLARIAATPDAVRLSQPMRQVVARLAANPRVRVWIISGRQRSDVRERARIPGVRYVGIHGWERFPGTALSPETQRLLDEAKGGLRVLAERIRGVWIEDKGPSFAIHYRAATDQDIRRAHASLSDIMARLNGNFRLLSGKKVWEVLPKEVGDKGYAVRRELSRLKHHTLPVYIGDDVTDERAFCAIPEGLTIRVGQYSLTRARFQLRDPADVRRFLENLEAEL